MIVRPTTSEQFLPINDDLSVHYSVFKDGYVFTRPDNAWNFWREMPFSPPVSNPWLLENHNDGVQFVCCEHASVAIAGDATYTLKTREGLKDYIWTRGTHNVDNGLGYLPAREFTRTFRNGFSLCCILQPYVVRDGGAEYRFEVITGPFTLARDCVAMHFCTGSRFKQTDLATPAGAIIDVSADDITIVAYLKN